MQITKILPQDIEKESFRIIAEELGDHNFSPAEFAIVQRVIHATADFEFAKTLRFHPNAIAAGLAALQAGMNILVDVGMAQSGIAKTLLARHGGWVVCKVAEPETRDRAASHGLTRSEAAIELAAKDNIGIVAVGNAPTALLKTMELIESGVLQPRLVIGVPVGFVNALESKAILAEQNYPFITALGRKGGTPVNVAIVNALLHLAAAATT